VNPFVWPLPGSFNDIFLLSVKSIENLSGHTISAYQVHGGGKSVPLVRTEDQTKMEEGEYFAIETFGSTGRGRVVESVSGTRSSADTSLGLNAKQGDCSHYARKLDAPNVPLR
jgi:methionyl aminopeptidase